MGETRCRLCLCITHQRFRFLLLTLLQSVQPPPFSLTCTFPVCVCVRWCDHCSERRTCMSSSYQLLLNQPLHYSSARFFHPYGDYPRAQLLSFLTIGIFLVLLWVYVHLLQCFLPIGFLTYAHFSLLHVQNPQRLSTQPTAPPVFFTSSLPDH